MLDFLNPWFLMPRLSECAGDPARSNDGIMRLKADSLRSGVKPDPTARGGLRRGRGHRKL
jgi:hypothetical protein